MSDPYEYARLGQGALLPGSDFLEENAMDEQASLIRRGLIEPTGIGEFGYGYGYGSGSGKDFLDFQRSIKRAFSMLTTAVPGGNYLVFCPWGLRYAARFVRRTGLAAGEFADAWNIHDTNNGNVWGEIADDVGRARSSADIRFFSAEVELQVILIRPWKGELPER